MTQSFAKRAAPIAALLLGTSLSGCYYSGGWGEVDGVPLAELDMSGDAPDTIRTSGPDRIVISEGDSLAITLEGDAEAGDALRFDRDGDRLTIARDQEVYSGSRSAIVRISMPAPSGLEVAGSGGISSETMASVAEMKIGGSGSIAVEQIEAEELTVSIGGAGSIEAAGSAQDLTVSISGSGNVRFAELMANDVSVQIGGSGDVELASNGSVDAQIGGSGSVVVTGTASCSVQTGGSGSLTCRPGPESAEASSEDEETAAE